MIDRFLTRKLYDFFMVIYYIIFPKDIISSFKLYKSHAKLVSVDSVLQNNTHFVQNATQNIVFVPSKKTSSNKLIIKTTTRPAPGAIHLRHRDTHTHTYT